MNIDDCTHLKEQNANHITPPLWKQNLLEIEKCALSPHYFLSSYATILDANEGKIPFDLWGHQIDTLEDLIGHRLVIILKARQIGMTWLMAGYALWKALFTQGGNIILLSKSEDAAAETLSYIRYIHSQLPEFLQVKKGRDSGSLMDFPSIPSKIRALSATSSAGIGFGQASLIVADEWDLWENQDDVRRNYAEIKPMIDRAGQFVILSAVNKYEQDTKFKEIWFKAETKENNFHPIFWDCFVLPERTEEWYEAQKREYDQWEIEGRYPRTIQEAMSAPKLVCRFDVEALIDLRSECTSPLRTDYNGLVKIYRESIAGRRYCLVADPSEGDVTSDPSVAMIIEDVGQQKVAEFCGRISLDEQARIIYELYEKYNQPFTAVERNACGLTLIDKLKDMGLTKWYFHDKQRQKEGWWTSTNRSAMISDLADAVHLRDIREPNPEALDQFSNFIRTKRKPDGEARGGAHDDYVMAWAIFLQIRKEIPASSAEIISARYKVSR